MAVKTQRQLNDLPEELSDHSDGNRTVGQLKD